MKEKETKIVMEKVAAMLTDLAAIVRTSDDRTDILDRLDHLHRDASNVLLKQMTSEEALATISQWAKDVQEIVQSHNENEKLS